MTFLKHAFYCFVIYMIFSFTPWGYSFIKEELHDNKVSDALYCATDTLLLKLNVKHSSVSHLGLVLKKCSLEQVSSHGK